MLQNKELSAQEREVTRFVAQGYTNKEIAAATGLAPATVKSYLEAIRLKTGTGNRVELTNWWNEHGARIG
jgi:DNA-binding CsgD family transcriptional regulator